MSDEIWKLDLYEIIGTTISANESEIRSAYRKKALQIHPDKNKDNPKAKELFEQLTEALKILTDTESRAAYDKVVNAKAQAKVRAQNLDAKRKKFKDDLEAREEAFKKSQTSNLVSDEAKLKAQVERLRKEGSRLVEEEKERVYKKILEELNKQRSGDYSCTQVDCRVNIKWKVDAEDTTNGGYNYENLHRFLSKWGEISELVLLPNKKGKALVEFANRKAAESAVNYERGLINNPLRLKGTWDKTKTSQQTFTNIGMSSNGGSLFPSAGQSTNQKRKFVPEGLSCSSIPDIFNTYIPTPTETTKTQKSKPSFESAVLENLRRAEERKRIIEQMEAEDEKT